MKYLCILDDNANFNKLNVRLFQNAQYIPELARMNPNYFGVSVCSVDGQRCLNMLILFASKYDAFEQNY